MPRALRRPGEFCQECARAFAYPAFGAQHSAASAGQRQIMDDLLDEMRQCKSVPACIDLALTDAYGDDEQAGAWLACIETMFSHFQQVTVLGHEVPLVGFDLHQHSVVAVCQQGTRKARVTLDSVEFPGLTPVEQRWLKAWQKFCSGAN